MRLPRGCNSARSFVFVTAYGSGWAGVSGHVMRGLVAAALPAMFPVALLFYIGVWLNLILAVFNLLPLPPLDGSHLLRNVLPYNWV